MDYVKKGNCHVFIYASTDLNYGGHQLLVIFPSSSFVVCVLCVWMSGWGGEYEQRNVARNTKLMTWGEKREAKKHVIQLTKWLPRLQHSKRFSESAGAPGTPEQNLIHDDFCSVAEIHFTEFPPL